MMILSQNMDLEMELNTNIQILLEKNEIHNSDQLSKIFLRKTTKKKELRTKNNKHDKQNNKMEKVQLSL